MKLYIKNMVSHRCKMMVKEELTKLGVEYLAIDLGTVELVKEITISERQQLNQNLLISGLELLDDKKSILIEKIKNEITQLIHHTSGLPALNYSNYLSEKLAYDYTYLANVFSEVQGTTIQQFIIINKIEKAKELLLYNQLNLTQIASLLHYSSVSHLSNQFKKTTGFSPSSFRQLKHKRSKNLEDV